MTSAAAAVARLLAIRRYIPTLRKFPTLQVGPQHKKLAEGGKDRPGNV